MSEIKCESWKQRFPRVCNAVLEMSYLHVLTKLSMNCIPKSIKFNIPVEWLAWVRSSVGVFDLLSSCQHREWLWRGWENMSSLWWNSNIINNTALREYLTPQILQEVDYCDLSYCLLTFWMETQSGPPPITVTYCGSFSLKSAKKELHEVCE